MRASDISSTRELPLFRNMTDAHFGVLTSAALLQKFPPHTTLIREGDLPDFLHVLVEGAVELFASWEGRETTVDIIGPVTTFILAAVIRDEVYLKSARTLSSAGVLMIPAQAVREVFGRDAAFARAIVNELAERYRRVVRVLKDQKLRSGVERLANWILEQDQAQGNQGRVTLSYDKRRLSARLGMTPENLSRNMASLKDHGIVARGRDIVITDRKALENLAKPNALIDGPQ
ncbi:MAG: helix-turn-helix domain-containing protein [Xanthobacteraceae bacterium]